MQVSGKSEELYDELAKRIDARDDAAARHLFQELLKHGRSRQEIVVHVSRLIEKRGAGQKPVTGNEETRWLKPHLSIGSGISEDRNNSSASADTPPTTQHFFGTSAEQSSPRDDAGSERFPLSVPERLASKLQLQNESTPADARQTVPAAPEARQTVRAELQATEVVPAEIETRTIPPERKVKEQSKSTPHRLPGWSRRLRTVLAGASAMTTAVAVLFVLWILYGNEEVLLGNAKHVLTWLQGFPAANLSTGPSAKPAAVTAQPEQATGVHDDSKLPATDNTPQTAKGDSGSAVTAGAERKVEPDPEAMSPQASSQPSERTPSRTETPSSQLTERAVSSSTPPNLAQQNETLVGQRAQTAETQRPSIDTETLIAQGDQFLSKRDVASARLLYQRAAEAGDGRGALRMGMTFDPVFLMRWRLRGIRADRAQAIAWYRHASALGNAEGELMQKTALQSQAPRVAARSHYAQRRAPPHQAKRG